MMDDLLAPGIRLDLDRLDVAIFGQPRVDDVAGELIRAFSRKHVWLLQ